MLMLQIPQMIGNYLHLIAINQSKNLIILGIVSKKHISKSAVNAMMAM